ncbi:MAG: ComF family protein [Magnetococcales bacterium]|nr:ComF family protein [Magnetococcales bacterium]
MRPELLRHGWSLLLDTLFPATCPLCRREMAQPNQICAACLPELPRQPENYCLRCGMATKGVQRGCGHCEQDPDFAADASYFAYCYEGQIAKWLVGMKFSDHSEWSRLLGWLAWQRLQRELTWESPDMLVPVPLHPYRLIARRYNQSALLARALAGWLNRPLQTNALHRIKRTQPQTHLNGIQRAVNLRGAFHARNTVVQGRSVLLVDDVFTTGATTQTAVRALKEAGAKRVAVTCLAAVQHGQAQDQENPFTDTPSFG